METEPTATQDVGAGLVPAQGEPSEVERLRAELDAAQAALQTLTAERDAARQDYATAVARYRQQVIAAHADIVPDLVAGQTIEEVDSSLERAKSAFASLRERIVGQATPLGGAPRQIIAEDLSALSPEAKIAVGLSRR